MVHTGVAKPRRSSEQSTDGFPLPPSELDRIRGELERERERLSRRLARYEADVATHRERVAQRDPCVVLSPAAATEDSEQEVRSRMANETADALAAVEAAMRRLADSPERFGLCHRCGQLISTARLEVLPHSAVCERCVGAVKVG